MACKCKIVAACLIAKDKDKWFLWRFITAKKTELIFLSLTYNPLTVSLSSVQLSNAGR